MTLALNGDSVASVPANSQISLIPYWTLGTIFPASNSGVSFTATTSTRSFQTQILIPNYGATGTNLGYSQTYYFINSGSDVGWRLFGDSTSTDHGNDILIPSGFFVVRNNNGTPTLPLVVTGSVLTGKVTTGEATLSALPQDNAVSMVRPLSISLNQTGLTPADGSFVASTSTRSLEDQLFVYNNAQVALNKAPSATYFYMNGAWRLFGDALTVDHGTDLISAGSAFIIRKAASGTGDTDFWQNNPTY